MANQAGSAVVVLRVKGRKQVANELSGMQKRLQAFGSSIRSMGGMLAKGLAAGGAVVGAGLAAGLAKSIQAASDMQETMNKFNVVFGESADIMKTWSDQTAQGFGRSKQQVASFLASAQDLLVPMGMAPDKASDMSQALTTLAMDLGSFNNMADADVMRDLQAALTGSGEVMKKYGVIVSESVVKQELLNQGLNPSNATEAQKAMARYNIILRGTTAAQGDVARSSNSFANQWKAIQAAASDLFVVIGSELLPVIQEWMTDLQVAMRILMGTADNTDTAKEAASGLADTLAWLISPVELAMRGFYALGGVFRWIQSGFSTMAASLAAFVKLLARTGLAKSVFGEMADQVGDAAEQVQQDLDRLASEQLDMSLENFNLAFSDDLKKMMDEERAKLKKEKEAANQKLTELTDLTDSNALPAAADKMKDAADKMVQAASPDSLEFGTTAFQRFEQNRREEELKALKKIQAALEKAPLAVGIV